MTAEKLRSENYPNILEDPVAFVHRVEELRLNKDPADQSAFKESMLDQWTKINLEISKTPYQDITRPNGRSRGLARIVTFSDLSSLTQWDTNEDALVNRTVEFLYASPSSLSPDNKNRHTIRISFISDPRPNRGLDKVFIEDQFLGVNPESKPFVKLSRLVINISPFTIVSADNTSWNFLFPPQSQGLQP